MMTQPNYQKTYFLLSVAQCSQLPPDTGIEIALIGRSNAGKSSVLNRLTQNKSLARTSKTPGRTQMINLFAIDDTRRLADLPGYGYAKVPPIIKQQWNKLLDQYLRCRQSLRGLVLVMDIRHPFKEGDHTILAWANESLIPVHILLNKVDKLPPQQSKKMLQEVALLCKKYKNSITLQSFSALKNVGIIELRDKLNEWYQLES